MQKRLNLTKTVRKLPISENLERKGYYMHDDKRPDIKYDSEEHQVRQRRSVFECINSACARWTRPACPYFCCLLAFTGIEQTEPAKLIWLLCV